MVISVRYWAAMVDHANRLVAAAARVAVPPFTTHVAKKTHVAQKTQDDADVTAQAVKLGLQVKSEGGSGGVGR